MLPPVDGNIAQSWRNAAKKVEELIANEERAKYIAARSVEMFRDRFVSPASVGCYWRVSKACLCDTLCLLLRPPLPFFFSLFIGQNSAESHTDMGNCAKVQCRIGRR